MFDCYLYSVNPICWFSVACCQAWKSKTNPSAYTILAQAAFWNFFTAYLFRWLRSILCQKGHVAMNREVMMQIFLPSMLHFSLSFNSALFYTLSAWCKLQQGFFKWNSKTFSGYSHQYELLKSDNLTWRVKIESKEVVPQGLMYWNYSRYLKEYFWYLRSQKYRFFSKRQWLSDILTDKWFLK